MYSTFITTRILSCFDKQIFINSLRWTMSIAYICKKSSFNHFSISHIRFGDTLHKHIQSTKLLNDIHLNCFAMAYGLLTFYWNKYVSQLSIQNYMFQIDHYYYTIISCFEYSRKVN